MTRHARLKEVADVFNGKTPGKADHRYSGHPVLKIKNVADNGAFSGDFTSFVDTEYAQKFRKKFVLEGDILVLNSAHTASYVASKICQANERAEGSLPVGEWLIVRSKSDLILQDYIYFWIRSSETRAALMFIVNGIHLYPKDVGELLIPIPPLEEQRRIVDILNHASSIKRLRDDAKAKAREIIPALFVEMFGDPASNPKGWEVKKLSELGALDRGKSKHRPRNDPTLFGGNHPFIQTGDVANSGGVITTFTETYSDIGLAQSRLWKAGTLCITIAANIAKTGVLAFDACFPDSVVGFTPNNVSTTEYVQYFLHFLQPYLEKSAPQLAQKNINLEILRDINIPVPPRPLQQEFAERVAEVEGISALNDKAVVAAEQLAQSLMSQVFGSVV